MKQILQSFRDGKITIENVPVPLCSEGGIVSQTTYSLISPGTERMLLEFGRSGLFEKAKSQPEKVHQVLQKVKTDGLATTYEAVKSKLDIPHKAGYCNVGVVKQTKCNEFSKGDRIVSNGNHAEFVSVPNKLCAKIPDNVSDKDASFTVLGAIGLHGVRLLKPTLGETFVVFGLGLIGLLTLQILRANGCRVLGVDINEHRLSLAHKFGAKTLNPKNKDLVDEIDNFSKQQGVDGVIICASSKEDQIISQSAKICRKRGRVILVGVVDLSLDRSDFYEKEIKFQVACSYGPGRYDPNYELKGHDYPLAYVRWTQKRNFEAVLELMADGLIDVSDFVSDEFFIDNAKEAYNKVLSSNNSLAILFDYYPKKSKSSIEENTIVLKKSKIHKNNNKNSVTFLGAGNYASRFLIPMFKKNNANLHTLVSAGGISSKYFGKKFGFHKVSTDTKAAILDRNSDIVVIASRHNLHATQVLESLKSGKHVFCEKPLCLTLNELNEIEQLHKFNPQLNVQLGFNRRYAPFVKSSLKLLEKKPTKRNIIINVNAGTISKNHWTQDIKIGGGRIIGEVCHFIDLAQCLAQSQIKSYHVSSLDNSIVGVIPDTVNINLSFENGSIASIHYFANGHKSLPKEKVEIYASGSAIQINNFKTLKAWGFGAMSKTRRIRQDKGQFNCIKQFIDDCKNIDNHVINSVDMYMIMRTTIEISNSLVNRKK